MVDRRTAVEATPDQKFPFDTVFQAQLLRMVIDDPVFCGAVQAHLRSNHFESTYLGWIYGIVQRYAQQYGTSPSYGVVMHEARQTMKPDEAALMLSVIEKIRLSEIRDAQWLKDSVLEFVRRNIFVRTFHECRDLYNNGQPAKAYDVMQRRMEELSHTTWKVTDRSWYYEDLDARDSRRSMPGVEDGVPTGFPWLDKILDGGLKKGELGIWIAYPKIGKTTMLIQHGRAAAAIALKKVYHVVLEGSRAQVENRYDTCWMEEFYAKVKRNDVDLETYEKTRRDFAMMRGLMVVEGFTDQWDYNAGHIESALQDLWQTRAWKPDLIVVDYGDLLNARRATRGDYENQRLAFRDLKSLANRGYAVWTASAAQRPKEGDDVREHLIKSRMIADCYDKVRVADYLGSLNQTLDERRAGVMRLHAEMYRDNAAEQTLVVKADPAKMRIKQDPTVVSPSSPTTPTTPSMGSPRQMRPMV
jgi:replicative DNA helicase